MALYLFTGLYLCFVVFIIIGLLKHNPKVEKEIDDLSTVSIVIAARNEENNIKYLIDDLINQNYPKEKIEIIIANDRSVDRTGEIIDETAKKYSFFHHIKIKKTNKSMTPKKNALQQAIHHAAGNIIISTDADCRVPKTWVKSMASSVQKNKGISIGFSRVEGKSFFSKYQMIDFFSITVANAGVGGWNIFWSGSGQNLGYKKKSFEMINGFHPVKDKISGDDMYLVQAISEKIGGIINMNPRSFVLTKPVKSIKDFLNQKIRWSSNARNNLNKKPLFFIFLISAFFCNLTLLIGFLLLIPGIQFMFFIKFIFEGIVIFLGGRLFKTPISPLVYMVWSLIQPLYIPCVGILGLFDFYSWKK